jgi:hypothetical protein
MSSWSTEQFEANCAALRSRDPHLADELMRHQGMDFADLPASRVSPDAARQVVRKLCPKGACTDSILVAGIDHGWLWGMLYDLPVSAPMRAGYRPPLWFVARTIGELWAAMHLHDWRRMLADPRLQLFVGQNAMDQARRAMLANPAVAVPRVSVTLDAGIWPGGMNLDVLSGSVNSDLRRRLEGATRVLGAIYGHAPQAEPLNSARGLRVMGITARYTTFLQHSMRDWLAAFEGMGHVTRLVIEESDHEQLNSLSLAEACVEFRPDLILLIDHYRAELGGLPENVPCVMWLQDYLPNLFRPEAGAAQGPFDYVVGYNRTECTTRFGYPFARFMPAMVAVNERRFAPAELSEDEPRRYECDVCFVSHASKPADAFVTEQIAQNGPQVKPLLVDAFERLKGIYDEGLCISHPLHVRMVIDEAMAATRIGLSADSARRLADLFTHRINNALLRHQMIDWAAEMGVNIHLYGNGWERHPRFARFARGPADNATELRKIYGAARIGLQATPHGAVHQRLLEGLAAGGFFLIRYVPGDVIERIYQPLWDWCTGEGIESDDQIRARATPEVREMLEQLRRTLGIDPFGLGMRLIDDLRTGADTGWARSAGSVWPLEYDPVAFDSRGMLQEKIAKYLGDEGERRRLAEAMRSVVVERLTYRAVNERLLEFVGADLAKRTVAMEAAA